VVVDGETDAVPLADTEPTPLSKDTLVAFVVVHARLAASPSLMLAGVAVKVAVGGGTTVIVVCLVVLPVGPDTVSV
jgi:hypothetical protein